MDQTRTPPRPPTARTLPPRRSSLQGLSTLHSPAGATGNEFPSPHHGEIPGESPEEPHSPGHPYPQRLSPGTAVHPPDPLAQPLAFVGGSLIALITVLVPLASVVLGGNAAPPAPPQTGFTVAPPAGLSSPP